MAAGSGRSQVHQRGRLVALGEYINMVWNIAVGSAVGIFFGQLCTPQRHAKPLPRLLCIGSAATVWACLAVSLLVSD